MFELASPLWLLLLPLPFLIQRMKGEEQTQAALRVPFYKEVETLQSTAGFTKGSTLKTLLLWLIWIFTLVAAANPQWMGEPVKMKQQGRDLLLAVDISGSMREPDMVYQQYRVTRLMAVKKVVGDFVARRNSDRLGLVLFGSNAYLQAPLTFDTNTVQQMLLESEVGMAGEATAIGDAIALGIKRLKDYPDNKRVMILLTDGQNTSGDITPQQAADLAVTAKTKIYTIAFSPYDREVDSATIADIAQKTGGEFFRARNLQELEAIHHQLDQLEPSESDEETFRPLKRLFYWPLAIAFLLSLFMAVTKIFPNAFSFRSMIRKSSGSYSSEVKL